MKQLTVVKIGGNIVDDQLALEQFLIDFNRISAPKILIHGGGVMASQMAEKMGIETKMVKGRR
ncbi:MAG: acetylglutamate kinase, partial [Bacteroidales bacterium]